MLKVALGWRISAQMARVLVSISESLGAVPLWDPTGEVLEGAEMHRALHRARQRMQCFSAMYTLSEGRQGRGETTLKWETFVHASSPLPPR